MSKTQVWIQFRQLLPYFWLAVAVIFVYRISDSIGLFTTFFGRTWDVISPFFYGFILAYIINIPCKGIMKLLAKSNNAFIQKRKRTLSIIAVFVILIFLVTITLNLIIPAITASASFFTENVATYLIGIVDIAEYINNLNIPGLYISPEDISAWVMNFVENINFANMFQHLGIIADVGAALFSGLIALISSIYILFEKDRFKGLVAKLLNIFTPKTFNLAVTEIGSRLNKYFKQYIYTQTIDGIILGTMAIIVLTFIGSPYALILGIMLGVVNYIPYFGSIFGTIVAVIVVIISQGFTMGATAGVSLIVIQQIDANIIQPRLMSESFSLRPLLVIISITIGGAVAGVFGMLVAIPIVAVLKDIFDSVVEYYEHRRYITPK